MGNLDITDLLYHVVLEALLIRMWSVDEEINNWTGSSIEIETATSLTSAEQCKS